MDNPKDPHALTLTLSYGVYGARRERTIPLGALLRVGLALALCAICYQVGRWHGALEAQAVRVVERPAAAATAAAKPVPSANTGTGAAGLAPGNAIGENQDVITPLNVRDPSALVMGPGPADMAPASNAPQSIPTPPSAPAQPQDYPPARVYPRAKEDVKPSNRF
jgi:hypothetical protein